MIKNIAKFEDFQGQTKILLRSIITKMGELEGGDIANLCLALKSARVGSRQ